MGSCRVESVIVCFCCVTGGALCATSANGQNDQLKNFPKGSEKAVAAVRAAFPQAEIDEAAEPKGFGGSGGKGTPRFWTVRLHSSAKEQELSVTPEGVIIRLPRPVEVNDLPEAVTDAVAKAAPGETIKSAERNEMRATMKYVALAKPQVRQYAVDMSKDGKMTRFLVSPDGKNAKPTNIAAEKKAEKPEIGVMLFLWKRPQAAPSLPLGNSP